MRVRRRPQGHVQHGPVLGDVDVLAREHRFDALAQPCPFGERDQQSHRFGGEPVLGVVEDEVRRLDDHLLASMRVGGEQVTEVHVPQQFEVVGQSVPLR